MLHNISSVVLCLQMCVVTLAPSEACHYLYSGIYYSYKIYTHSAQYEPKEMSILHVPQRRAARAGLVDLDAV